MARTRSIKPSFFSNEVLTEIEPIGRLLFIGLWTIADREGRLEDRPGRIKMQLFPNDDLDVDRALASLAERGFLLRYEIDSRAYIQVVNFAKHQHPHPREAPSTIPAPPEHDQETGPASPTNVPSLDEEKPRHDQGTTKSVPSRARSLNSNKNQNQNSPVVREATPRARTRPPRHGAKEPDDWFVTVCLGVYEAPYGELTQRERNLAKKAADELRDMGIPPPEIARRCAMWRRAEKWRELILTPDALVKHWTKLGKLAENGADDGGTHRQTHQQVAAAKAQRLAELDHERHPASIRGPAG